MRKRKEISFGGGSDWKATKASASLFRQSFSDLRIARCDERACHRTLGDDAGRLCLKRGRCFLRSSAEAKKRYGVEYFSGETLGNAQKWNRRFLAGSWRQPPQLHEGRAGRLREFMRVSGGLPGTAVRCFLDVVDLGNG